jgi:hypothetical protein
MDAERFAALKTALAALVHLKPGEPVGPVLDAIERAQAGLGPGLDPRLSHYLTGHSYVKALAWLEGREADNAKGACG